MWLRLSEGESVKAFIDISSIKSIAKHWTGSRLELCLGQGCPHCARALPVRWRYQTKLIIDRENYDWEFGEQTMKDLIDIPHETNWAHGSITRHGSGRNTRVRVLQADVATAHVDTTEPVLDRVDNKYTRGKYGHRVQT